MKPANQRTKLMKKIVRDIETWKMPHRTGIEDLRASIQKLVRSGKPQTSYSASVDLDTLGQRHAMVGLLKCLHGDAEGWVDLDKTLQCYWWYSRIAAEQLQIRDDAQRLAFALVFGEDRMVAWYTRHLLAATKPGVQLFQEWSPFTVFMLRLSPYSAELVRDDWPKLGGGLGVYRGVLDAWHDEPALTHALLNACDYHLDETVYSDEVLQKEFESAPYDLFPVDILAIARVREQQGLRMPELDHPLMQTPLAKPPPNDKRPRMPPDPLIDAVLAKARKEGFLPINGDDFA